MSKKIQSIDVANSRVTVSDTLVPIANLLPTFEWNLSNTFTVMKQFRLTTLLDEGRMASDLGLAPVDPARDRFMICGSPSMLADFRRILDARGFTASPKIGVPGHYVFERAFVER